MLPVGFAHNAAFSIDTFTSILLETDQKLLLNYNVINRD